MTVSLWGVRGSTPTAGAAFDRYGGNTTCVSVCLPGAGEPDRMLVLDAGTGIRRLGHELAARDDEVFVLLTHLHADHLFGFPFFAPLYQEGRRVHLLEYPGPGGSWSPLSLFDGVHYPLRPDDLPADVVSIGRPVLAGLRDHGLRVDRHPVNHPGGAFAYRVHHGGWSFVFAPDSELDPPRAAVDRRDLVDFCRGADLLCHDAQYLDRELAERRGWGHSSVEQACDLAREAGVGRLLLFHHDPDRTDDDLDGIGEYASELLEEDGVPCTVAREGLRIEFSERGVALTDEPAPVPAATPAESA